MIDVENAAAIVLVMGRISLSQREVLVAEARELVRNGRGPKVRH